MSQTKGRKKGTGKFSFNFTAARRKELYLSLFFLDEQAFRLNQCQDNDGDRFMKAVKGIIDRGIKYLDSIGKGGDDLQQASV